MTEKFDFSERRDAEGGAIGKLERKYMDWKAKAEERLKRFDVGEYDIFPEVLKAKQKKKAERLRRREAERQRQGREKHQEALA